MDRRDGSSPRSQTLLKREHTSYSIHPVSGYEDLKAQWRKLAGEQDVRPCRHASAPSRSALLPPASLVPWITFFANALLPGTL